MRLSVPAGPASTVVIEASTLGARIRILVDGREIYSRRRLLISSGRGAATLDEDTWQWIEGDRPAAGTSRRWRLPDEIVGVPVVIDHEWPRHAAGFRPHSYRVQVGDQPPIEVTSF